MLVKNAILTAKDESAVEGEEAYHAHQRAKDGGSLA